LNEEQRGCSLRSRGEKALDGIHSALLCCSTRGVMSSGTHARIILPCCSRECRPRRVPFPSDAAVNSRGYNYRLAKNASTQRGGYSIFFQRVDQSPRQPSHLSR
jgi:hypothetical protein